MKLLKIVLIALVTVGIYSFTTNPISKKEEVNYKKGIIEQHNMCNYYFSKWS